MEILVNSRGILLNMNRRTWTAIMDMMGLLGKDQVMSGNRWPWNSADGVEWILNLVEAGPSNSLIAILYLILMIPESPSSRRSPNPEEVLDLPDVPALLNLKPASAIVVPYFICAELHATQCRLAMQNNKDVNSLLGNLIFGDVTLQTTVNFTCYINEEYVILDEVIKKYLKTTKNSIFTPIAEYKNSSKLA